MALDVRPDIIINAAYRQTDWETTADGAAHVALAAVAAGARLVHVSSDAVFSGTAPSYDETRQPDPVTPYGAAKAAAETAVKGIAPAAVIARTSLIIGDGDSPHERLVHALASGAAGALFADEVRCPVHVADLASALLELAASPHTGISHLAGTDAVSRYQLGLLIAARDGLDQAALRVGLRAATGRLGALDDNCLSSMPCASRQLRRASSASCHWVASIWPPGPRSTYASRWAGSTRRVSSGNCPPCFQPGQPLTADDGDELLAESPQARYVDVSLQTQQAPRWHVPGIDLVHNGGERDAQVAEGRDQPCLL